MARYANDGMIRVQLVTTIANIAAPTTTELNTGINVSNFITKDGLTVPSEQNMVPNASLAETFNAQVVGSFGGAITMTGILDFVTNTFYDLVVYATATNIVIRRGIATATAFASSQKLQVYPSQWHEPVIMQTESDGQGKFSAMAAVTSQPNVRAAVA